jgi:hypothetical protein
MHLPPAAPPGVDAKPFQNKLAAAMILRGVVRLTLEDGDVEVQPRTWYRENGLDFLEARRRDSGERMVVRLDRIRGVSAY